MPVLGLLFLRYADAKFTQAEEELQAKAQAGSRRKIGKDDYKARGVLFPAKKQRVSKPCSIFPKAPTSARRSTPPWRPSSPRTKTSGHPPRNYGRLSNDLLVTLLKTFNSIPMDIEGDAFGKIHEYFLGEFAMSEGKKGGEFFTPDRDREADRRGHRALPRPHLLE